MGHKSQARRDGEGTERWQRTRWFEQMDESGHGGLLLVSTKRPGSKERSLPGHLIAGYGTGVSSVAGVRDKVRSWLRREPKVVVPRTILIVDGNAAHRQLTARLVESLGYRSLRTAGLASAIEQLEANDPEFVLLGFDLDDGSGLEALSQVREIAPELPIVMLADDIWDSRVAEALRRGAVAYLARPFGRESLQELLVHH